MGKTKIEWTERTWNPVRGCSVVSEGCRNCYAMNFATRFAKEGEPYEGLAYRNGSGAHWTGKVRLIEEHLQDPLRWKKPARIFVNSMSDLFHESIPDESIDRIFAVMQDAHQHVFQVLTKRPARMLEYLSNPNVGIRWGTICHRERWPVAGTFSPETGRYWQRNGLRNVWLGVSVEDQKTADERIPLLLQTPAAVRWISAEPLLGSVDLMRWLRPAVSSIDYAQRVGYDRIGEKEILDWVVVGGESGANARGLDLSWVRAAVRQCQAAAVPVFVKQLGAHPFERRPAEGPQGVRAALANIEKPHLQRTWFGGGWTLISKGEVSEWIKGFKFANKKGGDINEWPEDLRVREFPSAA